MTPPDAYFEDPDFVRMEAEFHNYVAQGAGRNIAWLASRCGLSITKCAQGFSKGGWPQRIAAVGQEAAIVARNQLVGDVAGLNTRDVGALSAFIELTDKKLAEAIEQDRVPAATLWKINEVSRARRREILGLGAGEDGDIIGRMQKFLESTRPTAEEKPFVLDLTKLESPPELPEMPGQTSDALPEPPEEEEDEDDENS